MVKEGDEKKNVEKKDEWEEIQLDKHTDRKERKKERKKKPSENEIFPLTINNRSLPEKII